MKYTYIGSDERVIPSRGLTVKPGDEFDAPAGLKLHDVVEGSHPVSSKTSYKADAKDGDKDGFVQDGTEHERPTKTTVSAASDLKAGE